MKEDITFEDIKERFSEFLEKKKLRKTPERFAILKKIFDYEGHFDADKLFQTMPSNYRVSQATIYNTLDLLLDCGMIIRHPFAEQSIMYEKTFGGKTHHHLVCTQCGMVKEFSDKKIRHQIEAKKIASFEVNHYSLYLYGTCKKCLQTKK